MLRADRLDGSHLLKAGSKWALEGVVAQVFRTGRSARMDGYSQALGEMTAIARRVGGRSRVGAPIIIDDRLWGAAVALNFASDDLPAAAVEHIANFADLITTAMSNAETPVQAHRVQGPCRRRRGPQFQRIRRRALRLAGIPRICALAAEPPPGTDIPVARRVVSVLRPG